MYCTLYAPFITLDYNSNISNKYWETEFKIENIIKEIANKQIAKWLLSRLQWWLGIEWVKAITKYFKWNYISLNKNRDRELIKRILNTGWALTTWIDVDIDYFIDSADWILDEKWATYRDSKHKVGHFTTIAGSNDNVVKFDKKYSVIDSYAFMKKRQWIYSFNDIDWFLDNLSLPTLYYIF